MWFLSCVPNPVTAAAQSPLAPLDSALTQREELCPLSHKPSLLQLCLLLLVIDSSPNLHSRWELTGLSPKQDGWHRTKPWQCQHVQMTHRTTVFRGSALGFMGWAPGSCQGELTLHVHSALWGLHKHGLGALDRLLSPSSCPVRAGLNILRNATVSHPPPLEMSELPRKDEKKHKTHTMLNLDHA